MSLSKIVTNLRNKLKEEEKRNQSVSNKLDQVIKEKEHIKTKLAQLQKEIKMKGVVIGRDGSFAAPANSHHTSTSAPKSLGSVRSRIDTGRSSETA